MGEHDRSVLHVRDHLLAYCARRRHDDAQVAAVLATISGVDASGVLAWMAHRCNAGDEALERACERAAANYLVERGQTPGLVGDIGAPKLSVLTSAAVLSSKRKRSDFDAPASIVSHLAWNSGVAEAAALSEGRYAAAFPSSSALHPYRRRVKSLAYSPAAPSLLSKNSMGSSERPRVDILMTTLRAADLISAVHRGAASPQSGVEQPTRAPAHQSRSASLSARTLYTPLQELGQSTLASHGQMPLASTLPFGAFEAARVLSVATKASTSVGTLSGGVDDKRRTAEFSALLRSLDAVPDAFPSHLENAALMATQSGAARTPIASQSSSWCVPLSIDLTRFIGAEAAASNDGGRSGGGAMLHRNVEHIIWDLYRPAGSPLQVAHALCVARDVPVDAAPQIANAISSQLIAFRDSVTPSRASVEENLKSQLERAAEFAGFSAAVEFGSRGECSTRDIDATADPEGLVDKRSAQLCVPDVIGALQSASYVVHAAAEVPGREEGTKTSRVTMSLPDLMYAPVAPCKHLPHEVVMPRTVPAYRMPHGFVADIVPSGPGCSDRRVSPWLPVVHPAELLREWVERTRVHKVPLRDILRVAAGDNSAIVALLAMISNSAVGVPVPDEVSVALNLTIPAAPTTTRRRETAAAARAAAASIPSATGAVSDMCVSTLFTLNLRDVLSVAANGDMRGESGSGPIAAGVASVQKEVRRRHGSTNDDAVSSAALVAVLSALNSIIALIAQCDVEPLLHPSAAFVANAQHIETRAVNSLALGDAIGDLHLQSSTSKGGKLATRNYVSPVLPASLAALVPGALFDTTAFDSNAWRRPRSE